MVASTLTPEQRDKILRAATSAPSKHNTQPWWFRWDGADLEVHVDTERVLPHADPAGREAHIACGAAVFAARLGYAAAGIAAEPVLLPDGAEPGFVARIHAVDGAPDARFETLYWTLPSRRTNRALFRDTPVPGMLLEQLRDAARDEGTWLRIVDREPAYEHLLTLIREATGLEEEHLRDERARWVAAADEIHRRDGVPAASLGPSSSSHRSRPGPGRRTRHTVPRHRDVRTPAHTGRPRNARGHRARLADRRAGAHARPGHRRPLRHGRVVRQPAARRPRPAHRNGVRSQALRHRADGAADGHGRRRAGDTAQGRGGRRAPAADGRAGHPAP
ncbi:hypothetical protein ACU686_32565 [Yinghuangia aomiensis]